MAHERVKIGILVQNGRTDAYGDGTDEAINQLANGLSFPATETVKSGGIVVIPPFRRKYRRTGEQPAQALQMPLVSRAGEHFHANRIADRNLALEQCVDTLTNRRPGVSKKFDERMRLRVYRRPRNTRARSSECRYNAIPYLAFACRRRRFHEHTEDGNPAAEGAFNLSPMTVGSLFSGMGGFTSGFASAGFKTLWANDADTHACAAFRHRFPDVPLFEQDVRELSARELQPVDVLEAGFPCQSFSQAGGRKGFDDRRGKLFFEIPRIVSEFAPQERPRSMCWRMCRTCASGRAENGLPRFAGHCGKRVTGSATIRAGR